MPPSSPPRSICLVNSTLAKPGGAEKNVALMANFWARSGVGITVLTFDDPSVPLFFELDANVRLHSLHLARRSNTPLAFLVNNVMRILELRRAIRKANVEVVISFITAVNVLVLLACVGLKQKVIVCERSVPDLVPERPVTRWLSKLTYRRATAIVAQSWRAADFFLPVFKDVLRVIPNPVPPPDAVRIAREKPVKDVIAIGRFTEEKCFDALITAFSEVAGRHRDWNLTIYGDGPLRSDLQTLVENLRLKDRVSLPGTLKNTMAVLASADLFVLASRFEGFPNALCEAMSVGLPVIATDSPGGTRDLVRDGVDGILVPVSDSRAMASALDRLMSDAAERDRLGLRATEVSKRFDLHEVMKMWNEAIMQTFPA